MTNLRSISISHNPDLTIDLDVLADVVDTLTYLDIGFHEAMI